MRESMVGWDLCDLVSIRVYKLLLYLIVKYGDLIIKYRLDNK